MEINSNSSSFSSSSSNSSTKTSTSRFLQPYRVIHKPSSTKQIMKHHIAPMPKIPPKIYKVEPKEFKNVVQKLTGPQPDGDRLIRRSLKDLAPPPLDLSPTILFQDCGNIVEEAEIFSFPVGNGIEIMGQGELDHEIVDDYLKNLETLIMISPKLLTHSWASTNFGGLLSPLTPAFILSPASLAWCSIFLSPGTVSTLDQSILLGG